MILRHRTTCRVCGSKSLKKVIDLGEQMLQGSFVKPGMPAPSTRKIPCVLVRCNPEEDENGCGLLQMQHSVPPEILYSSYWYRSGTNQTMRDHLKGIATEAASMIRADEISVLDIGCNDATLLSCYPETFKRVGIDPSDIEHPDMGGIRIVKDLFPSREIDDRFNIITSIAMFYDLEDPVSFAISVRRALTLHGIWIIEMSYMPRMLELNSYDTIVHEHLEYYSLSVIENIVKRAGLKVFRVEQNDINGGSFRCYVRHAECKDFEKQEWRDGIKKMRVSEFNLGLDTDRPYESFQNRIDAHKEALVSLIKDLRREGKTIHVLGASTKGNTILQWCGIDCFLIEHASDRNPDKHGASTLGTGIKIVSEEVSREMKPDVYLALAWHFKKELIEREQEFLSNGGRIIFPLPEVEIVG